MTVFVTDGHERPALAVTRSLGRAGFSVIVGADHHPSLAGASRYATRRVVYPSPHQDPQGFRQFLCNLVTRERVDVLMPVTDVTTRVVAAEQETIGHHTALAVPPMDAFETVTDKARLLQHAERVGLDVPSTILLDEGSGLGRVINDVTYPAVIKSYRSRIPTAAGWLGTSVHYAESRQEIESLYERHEYLARFPSLIQRRIVGPGVGLFALFDRGRIVTAFAHRRLREKPPSGGVSVLRDSVRLDHRLVDQANRLLSPLGWHGVAMVEYKRDAQSGVPFLMEVNGRFWGSLQLAIDSGVDFPLLASRLALGEPVDAPATYRIGVMSRWLLGDLDHLLLRLFRSDRELRLPEGLPSRAGALFEFTKFFDRDLHYEVLRREDIRPFLHEALGYASGFLRSATERVRSRSTRRTSPGATPLYAPKEYPHAGPLE